MQETDRFYRTSLGPVDKVHLGLQRGTMDWEDLRHFLAVARTGSVSRASKLVRASPSTVMKRVKDLEGSLGENLFDRSRDGYRLTPFGRAILERAEYAEAGAMAVWRLADARQPSIDEPVRVTTTDFLAAHWVAPLLGEYFAAHPSARVDLIPAAARLSLDRREADLSLRIGRPTEEGLIGRRIATLVSQVYGRADLPEKDLKWIGLVEEMKVTPFGRAVSTAIGNSQPILRTVNFNIMLEAVRAGVGKAQIPCLVGDACSSLRRLDVPNGRAEYEIWLIVHRDLRKTPRIRQLADFLADAAGRDKAMLEGIARSTE